MGLNSGLAVYLLTQIIFCAKHPASFTRHTQTQTNRGAQGNLLSPQSVKDQRKALTKMADYASHGSARERGNRMKESRNDSLKSSNNSSNKRMITLGEKSSEPLSAMLTR